MAMFWPYLVTESREKNEGIRWKDTEYTSVLTVGYVGGLYRTKYAKALFLTRERGFIHKAFHLPSSFWVIIFQPKARKFS